jgi:hypothetical protein
MNLLALVLVVLALAVAAVSLALFLRAQRAVGADSVPAALAAGGLMVLVLALVDHGAVLSWSFGLGVGEDRAALPGVGVALGVALLAATAGSLLLGIRLALPTAEGAWKAATAALWVAAAATGLGVALAMARLQTLSGPSRHAGVFPLALLATSALGLALVLRAVSGPTPLDAPRETGRAELAARLALALALVAAAACGLAGWWHAGTYATSLTAAASSAVLVGWATVEAPRRFGLCLRGLFLVALLGVLSTA